jgi:hypothetical protein
MPISANTLFHFTPEKEHLLNILKQNFRPRYCLEDMSYLKWPQAEIAFPMVCFCDIPLSQIVNHSKTYGSYAIGLTKQWGMNNKLTPMTYLHSNSSYLESIINVFMNSMGQNQRLLPIETDARISIPDLDSHSMQAIYRIMAFLKHYDGKMRRGEEVMDRVNFYEEREWRYIPEFEDSLTSSQLLMLSRQAFDLNKEENDKRVDHYYLKFTPKDIKYIIVSSENERLPLLQNIQDIKGNIYSRDDVKVLMSKVLSMEQVREDF